MTDEKARDNFLKYGNPDGKGSMAVGIALPNFLQKKEYQLQVLIVFFIVIVFLIPYYFLSRINDGEKDVGGVKVENRRVFTELINENMLGKHIPAMMAHSSELCSENKDMRVRSKEELAVLNRIKNHADVKDSIPKQKEGKPVVNVKPICLLMGYMHNLFTQEEQNDELIQKDLEVILRAVPSYIDIMLSQTMMLSQAFKAGRSPKRITAKNVMTLIQFSQNLMQGGWVNKDAYQQLPFVDSVQAGKMKNKLSGKTLF